VCPFLLELAATATTDGAVTTGQFVVQSTAANRQFKAIYQLACIRLVSRQLIGFLSGEGGRGKGEITSFPGNQSFCLRKRERRR